MNLKKYVRSVPDYPKKDILFRDITTLIKDKNAFNYTIDKMIEVSKKIKFDKIAAIESRGFIFASPMSYKINKPLILMRKENKLPTKKYSIGYELEYGNAVIEIHQDSIDKGEKILIIDDLIATGGTAEAAGKLVQKSNGTVAGFIFVINLFDIGGTKKLEKLNYKTYNLINFPGH